MILENILKVLLFEMKKTFYSNIDKYSQNGPIQIDEHMLTNNYKW